MSSDPLYMPAYHFCEYMAKQVTPHEYVITYQDVREAKAAWLALEKHANGLLGALNEIERQAYRIRHETDHEAGQRILDLIANLRAYETVER